MAPARPVDSKGLTVPVYHGFAMPYLNGEKPALLQAPSRGEKVCRERRFDLLAHLAFEVPIRTRREQADALANREDRFLDRKAPPAHEVILSLVDKLPPSGTIGLGQ